jgi:hypothetical protein
VHTIHVVSLEPFERRINVQLNYRTPLRSSIMRSSGRLLRGFALISTSFAFLGLSSVARAQNPDRANPDAETCAMYDAAIAKVAPDVSVPMIVYDSISLATPSFAFHAYTGMGAHKVDTGFVVTDSLWEMMRAQHRDRIPLPACFGSNRKVTRLLYDSIRAPFKDRKDGWDTFRKTYPTARGFYIFGRIMRVPGDSNHVLVYVAHAGDWLSGGGEVLILQNVGGVWKVRGSKAIWAS